MILKFGKQFNLYKLQRNTERKLSDENSNSEQRQETKYFNGYPLIEEEDIYSQDHLKKEIFFKL